MRVTLNIWSLLCPPAPSLLKKKLQSKLGQTKKKRKKSERHHKGLSPSTLRRFLMSRCPLFWRRALRRSTSGSSESCGNRGLSTADSSCAQITREMTSRSSLKRLWSVSLRAEDEFPAKAPGVRCAHRPAWVHRSHQIRSDPVSEDICSALQWRRAKSPGYMHYICCASRVYSSQRGLCDLLAFQNKSRKPVWMCHISCHLICVAKGFLMLA